MGLLIAPWEVTWFVLPSVVKELLRECVGCHLELLVADLRERVALLPGLPDRAPYVPSLASSSSSPAASSSSSSSSS